MPISLFDNGVHIHQDRRVLCLLITVLLVRERVARMKRIG